MKILVINCGSSSLKYQILDMTNETLLCKGLVEKIGIEGSVINHEKIGQEKFVLETPMKDHKDAIAQVLAAIQDPDHGVVKDMAEIGANIAGIEACKALMPDTPMVAVFDTAFHQTMPPESYIYALPYEYYTKYGIRRYGFHGTSHKYVAKRAAEMLNVDLQDLKLITCHLGNGASVSAIKRGKCIDTSMGFTPLEGLVMGTRSGDIDPALVTYIREKENLPQGKANEILNKKSGVLGISGVSSDFRDLEAAVAEGNERAELAIKVFAHKVRFYIGAYIAEMNGCDAIVFTAGVGENDIMMREMICNDLGNLGIKIDPLKNRIRGKETIISADDARVKLLLIPTNEELMIARDTFQIVKKLK